MIKVDLAEITIIFILGFKAWILGKKSNVSAPVSKPKIVETPTSKPKQLSSKFKKTDSGEQAKITPKARLREIAQENISDTVKKVTGKKDGGKPIPEGPEGAGLRALKAEAPEVVSEMGYKKKGGIVEGINNIKGMKNGGVCRGMGAATKGGSFNVSWFGFCMYFLWEQR